MSSTLSPSIGTATIVSVDSRLRARLALLLVASLWLLPLLLPLSQRPMLHFYREWLAAALALAACVVWLPLRGPAVVVPRSALYLLALAVYIPLQTTFARVPYHEPSLGYALYLAWAALLMTVVAGLREALGMQAVVRALCWAAFSGAILAAAVGCLQAYGIPAWIDPVIVQDRRMTVFGNIQHASYFADQLLIGVVAGAWLFASRRLSGWILTAGLVLIGLALALSGSRAIVAVLVLLPLSAAVLWIRQRQDPVPKRLAIATGAALIIMVAWEWATRALPILALSARHKSTLMRLPRDGAGMEHRWSLWEKALEIFADSPVFGAGADAFPWHYFKLLESHPPLSYTIHSHNLFTEFLACFGLIGTGLLMAALGGFGWRHRARLLESAWWPVNTMLAILFLRALLDLNLWFAHLLALFVVLMGVAERNGLVLRARHGVIALGSLATAGIVILAITIRDYRLLAGIGTNYTTKREIVAAIDQARRNPLFTALADSMLADGTPVARRGDRAQLALNSRSMNWRPTPRMVWRQSALLAVNGYQEPACRLLARAWRLYPRSAATARRLLARNADIPAYAALIRQLDALQAGADAQVLCVAPGTATPG